MLRHGAQSIALDDDSAFRKFSEADIESLLESSSSTSVMAASAEGSTFSKVAFVADGEQIDMSDPDFWQKLLPEAEGATAGEADESAEGYGRGRRRHKDAECVIESDDEGGDEGSHGAKRSMRKRDSCYDEGSSDGDDDGDDDELGPWERRDPSKQRRRRALDSEGEDEESSDGKLWLGAHAEGWRVHAKGGAHYIYVSPAVRSSPAFHSPLGSQLPLASPLLARSRPRSSLESSAAPRCPAAHHPHASSRSL